jgi:hypothetical protein
MSRMWRVQRRAFADEQRRRDHWHERLRLAYHESGHAIANLAHGAGVDRISAARRQPKLGQVLHRTDGSYRRLGAFGVQPGRRSGTRPHGEWTEDRIDAWLIAHDIDRDHVTETTAKAWSAAGKLVVQHRQALEGWPCTWSMGDQLIARRPAPGLGQVTA